MGLLRRIFGKRQPDQPEVDIRFGRYSDAYKPDHKYDAWDRALDLFEEGKYLESFTQFFDYLEDESQDNVKTWSDEEGLHFELIQGSKLIKGLIGDKLISAEARIAKATKLSIGFLRRLMELNYNMKYGRYALDQQNHLTLVFDSYLLDGSPYKLYYALKEIAVSADKQDDLLVKEFKSLHPVNVEHLQPIPEDQKAIKIRYLRNQIEDTLDYIDNGKFNTEQFSGGISYVMLDMAYRLDYLIKPEGSLTEALERIHRIYFTKDNKSHSEKNAIVYKEFRNILTFKDEEIGVGLYTVACSFGITTPGNQEQLGTFVDAELAHMDWYAENRHKRMALAFPGYIAGYSMFNYAYQPPARELLHFYYRITESAYFEELGYRYRYMDPETGELEKREILAFLEDWEDRHIGKFPKLKFDPRSLSFQSRVAFSKSYFKMLKGIDLTKASTR